MPFDEILLFGKEKMEKCVGQLKKEFASVRTGRANPMILDKVLALLKLLLWFWLLPDILEFASF